MNKTIITAAITGGIHTPGMSEYLPITPEEIINDAVKANEAGAAVVHIHARNPENGKPSSDIELFRQIISRIKEKCDVAICVTTGGSVGMPVEERLKPVTIFEPELASCNAGSVNFVLSPAIKRLKPKYDWEIPYLEGSEDLIFANTFKSIRKNVTTMNEKKTLPEFEVYDVGMINTLAHFKQIGVIKQPIYIQFVMGILGGIPASIENLAFMVKTAKIQLNNDFVWSVAAAGRNQFPLTTAALGMGGNVRVGLEDNTYLRPKVLAKSSAEQVIQIKEIAEKLGKQIATPDEARKILSLKGKDKVNF